MAASPILSSTSKMNGTLSWSTQAGTGCRWADISENSVCSYCYARNQHYRRPSVKRVRQHNTKDVFEPDWVDRMVETISRRSKHPFFRWFDSGDIRSVREARLIYRVMEGTPAIMHFLPTKSWRHPPIRRVLEKMNRLRNARCRYSSLYLDRRTIGRYQCLVYTDPKRVKGIFFCPAYKRKGDPRCEGCDACWKDVKVIGFPLHGRRADSNFGPLRHRLGTNRNGLTNGAHSV